MITLDCLAFQFLSITCTSGQIIFLTCK